MTAPDWQEFLVAAGARFNAKLVAGETGEGSEAIEAIEVADFGDVAGELLAAGEGSTQTLLAPLTHLALVVCSGDDAGDFLHKQLTSDVRALAAGSAQPSAWCTAKGRMLANFLLLRDESGYVLRLSADLAETIAKRLRVYVMRSKVKVAADGGRVVLGLAGAQADAALAAAGLPQPAADLALAAFAGGWVLRRAANGQNGQQSRYEIALDAALAPAVWQALATVARPVGNAVWRWLEIRAGWPQIGAATSEQFVPQMADFDRIGGVNFQKGCYPGQEIVARSRYLGQVKRHLYRVHAATPLGPGDTLWPATDVEQPVGGLGCGMIVDAAPAPAGGVDALAVIQEDFLGGVAGSLHLGAADDAVVQVGARVHAAGESA
jgi:folate-binding protein YgfZ